MVNKLSEPDVHRPAPADLEAHRQAMDRALPPGPPPPLPPSAAAERRGGSRVSTVLAVTTNPLMLEADAKLSRRPESVTLYLAQADALDLLRQLSAALAGVPT